MVAANPQKLMGRNKKIQSEVDKQQQQLTAAPINIAVSQNILKSLAKIIQLISQQNSQIVEIIKEVKQPKSADVQPQKQLIAAPADTAALQDISKSLAKILQLLTQQNSQVTAEANQERKNQENARRNKIELGLENSFAAVKNVAQSVIAPVKNILDSIIRFFVTLFLGKAILNLIDWFSKKENQSKIRSIARFLKDWWPALVAGYILFGTGFGRVVRNLAGIGLRAVGALGGITLKLIGAIATATGFKKAGSLMSGLGGGGGLKGLAARLLTGAAVAGGTALVANKMMGGGDAPQVSVPEPASLPVAEAFGGGLIDFKTMLAASGGQVDSKLGIFTQLFGSGGFAGLLNSVPGVVSGPKGIDKVPAMLTDGEFVMSRGAVQKFGVSNLEAMNASGGGTNKPKIVQKRIYAEGGGLIGDDARRKYDAEKGAGAYDKESARRRESLSQQDAAQEAKKNKKPVYVQSDYVRQLKERAQTQGTTSTLSVNGMRIPGGGTNKPKIVQKRIYAEGGGLIGDDARRKYDAEKGAGAYDKESARRRESLSQQDAAQEAKKNKKPVYVQSDYVRQLKERAQTQGTTSTLSVNGMRIPGGGALAQQLQGMQSSKLTAPKVNANIDPNAVAGSIQSGIMSTYKKLGAKTTTDQQLSAEWNKKALEKQHPWWDKAGLFGGGSRVVQNETAARNKQDQENKRKQQIRDEYHKIQDNMDHPLYEQANFGDLTLEKFKKQYKSQPQSQPQSEKSTSKQTQTAPPSQKLKGPETSQQRLNMLSGAGKGKGGGGYGGLSFGGSKGKRFDAESKAQAAENMKRGGPMGQLGRTFGRMFGDKKISEQDKASQAKVKQAGAESIGRYYSSSDGKYYKDYNAASKAKKARLATTPVKAKPITPTPKPAPKVYSPAGGGMGGGRGSGGGSRGTEIPNIPGGKDNRKTANQLNIK
jgi:hypothetical protein